MKRDYYKHFCMNKFNNLHKIDEILEDHKLPQDEVDNLKSPIPTKDMGTIVKTFGERNLRAQTVSLVKPTKHLRKKWPPLETTSRGEGSSSHRVWAGGRHPMDGAVHGPVGGCSGSVQRRPKQGRPPGSLQEVRTGSALGVCPRRPLGELSEK